MFNWLKNKSKLGHQEVPSYQYVVVYAPAEQIAGKSTEQLARLILDKALTQAPKDDRLYLRSGGLAYSVQTDLPELRKEIVRLCEEDEKYIHLWPYYIRNYHARFYRKAEQFH